MNKIFKDLVYAFSSQFISLLLSVIMSLIVPKILGVEEFSYWQLFLFYCTYVGFFHFGITDGVYLVNGGKSYEKLDKKDIVSQFWTLFSIQIFLIICIIGINFFVDIDYNRKLVLLLSGIYMCVANMNWYLGYVYQATNKIKIYAFSVMIDKALFIVCIIGALFFKCDSYIPFIYMYILTRVIALIYCIINGKDLVFGKRYPIKESLEMTKNYIKVGINLTLSSIASILILGIGRFVVDNVWGITAFGKFSFAISLANFFLMFISQISLILFPNLRQVEEKKLKEFYNIARIILGIVLPIVFIAYIPIKFILSWWLPQYEESLRYLALLLPLCTFDGKMQMLCNTYFKVLRKEKILLRVNALSMLLSTVLSLIGGFVVKNIYFIVISMVVSIAFRSIISEIYLCNLLEENKKVVKYIIQEVGIVIIFMVSSWFLDDLKAFLVILVTYIIYLILNRNNLKIVIDFLKQKMKNSRRKNGKNI